MLIFFYHLKKHFKFLLLIKLSNIPPFFYNITFLLKDTKKSKKIKSINYNQSSLNHSQNEKEKSKKELLLLKNIKSKKPINNQ